MAQESYDDSDVPHPFHPAKVRGIMSLFQAETNHPSHPDDVGEGEGGFIGVGRYSDENGMPEEGEDA